MVSSKCCVPGCYTGYASDRRRRKNNGERPLRLFSMPQVQYKFQEWKRKIPRGFRELTERDKICELHFLDEDIVKFFVTEFPDGSLHPVKKERYALKPNAIPSVFSNMPASIRKVIEEQASISELSEEQLCVSEISEEQLSVSDICEDQASVSELCEDQASLSELYEGQASPNELCEDQGSVNELSEDQGSVSEICEDQGSVDELYEEPASVSECEDEAYEISEEEASAHEISEDEASVHEISEEEASASKISEKRKSKNVPIPNKMMTKVMLPEQGYKIYKIVANEISHKFSFSTLVENISKINKPNKWWSISTHDDFINCVKWDATYVPERQIIIDHDLNYRVLYYGKEASKISNIEFNKINIESTESVSLLIKAVGEYFVCAGAKQGNIDCCVYLQNKWNLPVKSKIWCSACINSQNQESGDEYTRMRTKYKELFKRIAVVKKQNSRLEKKVAHLEAEYDVWASVS